MADGYRVRILRAVRAFLRGCPVKEAALIAGIHLRTAERLVASAEDAGFDVQEHQGKVRFVPR